MGRGLARWQMLCLATALAGLAACEHEKGPRTLILTGPVHVYRSETPPAKYPGTDFIAELGPKDNVKVLEVRVSDGYKAVKVRLADGREGWVFSGEGIEVSEGP